MSRVGKKQQGFTLIELMLSMGFVALLLMAIALTVLQIGNIYNKGITMKQVNQSGQALTSNIKSAIESSNVLSVAANGTDYKKMTTTNSQVAGARLCTGTASYIWNYGTYTDNPVNKYESSSDLIRFVRVTDRGKAYCNDTSKRVVKADATELLPVGERELAVQSFAISQVAYDSVLQEAIYAITLEIGTNQAGTLQTTPAPLSTVDTSCRPPSDNVVQQEYCAVNKFEFTAWAGNTGETQQ